MSEGFASQQARLIHAADLAPEHFDTFRRLCKALVHGPEFQLWVAISGDSGYREHVLHTLDETLALDKLTSTRVNISTCKDFAGAEAEWRRVAQGFHVMHVLGSERWFDPGRWRAFNLRREAIARELRARIVLWVTPSQVSEVADFAPDWWAWRGGVADLVRVPEEMPVRPVAQVGDHDNRSLQDRARRVAVLRDWLAREPPLAADVRGPLLTELAILLTGLGEIDEAMRIYREEQLPLFKKLGDAWSTAVTMGQIADLMEARGHIDEALRIRREEELPVYVRAGDVRGQAVTMGKIADALQIRGELEEALRVRRVEQLPVYERLGDMRGMAVTKCKIADVLGDRGDWDQALRIYREEAMPVFERLGDLHGKAVTFGRIARALQARGELDEALRIQVEEQMPVFERLGQLREVVIIQANVAVSLAMRGGPGDLDEAKRLAVRAWTKARELGLREAPQMVAWYQRTFGTPIPGSDELRPGVRARVKAPTAKSRKPRPRKH